MPYVSKQFRQLSSKNVVVVKKKVAPAGKPVPPNLEEPGVKTRPLALPPTKIATRNFSALEKAQPPKPVKVPAPPTPPADPEKKERERQARWGFLEELTRRYPKMFARSLEYPVRPLALGISHDIAKVFPDMPLVQIHRTIGAYQVLTKGEYLKAVAKGGARYDLNGDPRGEVTPDEQNDAIEKLLKNKKEGKK